MIVVLIILGYLLIGTIVAGIARTVWALVERFWGSLYEFGDWMKQEAILILFWPFFGLTCIIGAVIYPFAWLAGKIAGD